MATRQRLIDTVATMLDGTPYREIRVTDIARAAGTSPATFYQYFIDVEEVVLTLAEDTADLGARMSELLEGRKWRGAAGWQSACALVDGFLDFWRQQQPVLRVVDLLTEEGDARFRRARVRMLNTLTVALAEVDRGGRSGRRPVARGDGDGRCAGLDAGPRRLAPERFRVLGHPRQRPARGDVAAAVLGRHRT